MKKNIRKADREVQGKGGRDEKVGMKQEKKERRRREMRKHRKE